jgi:hypothetical protein
MNDKLRESIFNLIKDLENLAEVKKVLKVNDINGAQSESLIARWKGLPIPEPVFPPETKITEITEIKTIEESEPLIDEEPEALVVDEPEILDVEESVEEEIEQIEVEDSTTTFNFRR